MERTSDRGSERPDDFLRIARAGLLPTPKNSLLDSWRARTSEQDPPVK